MISGEIERGQRDRIDRRAPCAARTASNYLGPRFKPSRWLILGEVVVALLLSPVIPANGVTIDSETEPAVDNAYDDNKDSLLQMQPNAPGRDAITFDSSVPDSDENDKDWTFGLTSGQPSINQSVMLSGTNANGLIAKRAGYSSSSSMVRLDADHSVAMEELTVNDGFAHPTQLVILTMASSAALYLFLVLFYRHLQKPRGKRVRFGILWNAYKPVCGKCNGILHVLNDYSFRCPTCGVELGARGENGQTISPREALAKIRMKEYW